MKVYKKDVQSGPLRWLMRLSGWCALIVSAVILIFGKPENTVSVFTENPIVSLVLGVLLVALDFIWPDPARQRKQMKRKCKKLYAAICKALPSNGEAFSAAVNSGNRSLIEQQVRKNPSFAKDLFYKVPTKEALVYIHTLNQQAAYGICAEIAQAVKNIDSK